LIEHGPGAEPERLRAGEYRPCPLRVEVQQPIGTTNEPSPVASTAFRSARYVRTCVARGWSNPTIAAIATPVIGASAAVSTRTMLAVPEPHRRERVTGVAVSLVPASP